MKPSEAPPKPSTPPAAAEAGDFRDHISTAEEEGRRKWLYPKRPKGRFHRARAGVAAVLLLVMFGGPFVKLNGNPLLDDQRRRAQVLRLGVIFWPQDNLVFALGFLLFLMGIAVFTAAFGRLWCGWTCPQIVMMEMVFRKIEYFIEGDSSAQKALARAPWTAAKLGKKAAKHLVFLALSFLIGNTLLAYIIGLDALKSIVTDDPNRHLTGLTFMGLFTFVILRYFRPLPRAGLHLHLPLRPVSIHPAG